jgi:hypothetical protein
LENFPFGKTSAVSWCKSFFMSLFHSFYQKWK